MNTLSGVIAICRSVFASRSNRNAMAAILAILCVALFVGGALLVQQPHDTKRSRIGDLAKLEATAAGRSQSSSSNNKPIQEVRRESAGITPSPVFSVMKNDDVRKKLLDATKPRETDVELNATEDRTTSELASRSTSSDEGEEATRERKERIERRMLAGGSLKLGAGSTGSQEPEIKGPSREELAAQGLDGVSFDIQGVTRSEYNGDVRDLPPVPVNSRTEESVIEKPMDPAKVAAGAKASTEPYINVPLAPMPSPIQNFAGLSFNSAVTGGPAGAGWPPDVNGDVGLNHYIISVNDAYAIYNKTGTQLAAFTENSLWSGQGVGTPCNANNFGDPVVVYDQFADRWILTNFAFATSGGNPIAPYYECFAISKTSDPVAGGWWFYAVKMDTGAAGQPPAATLADYPKFGNWNDGCLYMAANGFGGNGSAYSGVVFASFNKADMESGAVLRGSLGFTATQNIFTMIPSNISGATAVASLPPAGTPNYFVSESTSIFALEVRKFTPGANCTGGSLGAPTIINQASYGTSLGNVVPQPPPATASHNLDTLDDRLMQKVQYRRVGSAESLWVTQDTRSSGANARPQWAELNVTGGTVSTTMVQTQIYAPDASLYRWIPSVAVDHVGNMAMGYSTSNATSPNFPSIAYSGRLVGDAANQLPQTEVQLIAGTGSQTTTSGGTAIHRWGDYTSMSVDPADDCTFWYAGMYFTNVGADATRNWNTRIGSFKFPTCTSGGCSTITGTLSGGGTICTGSSGTVVVDVTGGTSPYTVVLTNSGGSQTGSAGQTHFVFNVSPTTTTSYQLDTTSSHDNGSCPLTNSGSATVTVKQQPTATTGGNQAICANGTTGGLGANTPPVGGTGTWSVVSGGTGAFSDANDPNTKFTHTSGTGPVVVRWTVSNPPCANATADASITINQPPATPSITPLPASVCAGSTGNTATGPVASSYFWSITNGTITSASNIQMINYTAGGSGSVTLNLTVTNAAGCSASNSLMVTIKSIGIDKDHQSFAGNGGTGTVNVTPSDITCVWTANTAATFVHVTSGSSGVGNGTVQYSVDSNPGSNIRSATILIAGQTFTVYQGIDFLDVPMSDPFYTEIGKLSARGVTLGCGSGNYCPNGPVTRDQMAAFIMRSKGEFNPPTPATQRFNDVPPSNPFYNFIDRMAVLQITLGCQSSPPLYCPGDPVLRDQMAAFIMRGLGEFNPPTPGSQRFNDVPPSNPFYNFIDRMAVLQITLGCQSSPPLYCPTLVVSRGQMAAFLVRAFNL